MKLKDLARLTLELAELAAMLKTETQPRSRMVILQRVQEIMVMIGTQQAKDLAKNLAGAA